MDPELAALIGGGGSLGQAPADTSLGGAFNSVGAPGQSNLLAALKGVPALAPPVAQKVSTPNPPKIEPIKGGNLMALLQALGLPGQDLTKNYTLPSTLPAAIGVR